MARRSFFKSDCRFCKKPVAGNMMDYHQMAFCKPAIEHFRQMKMEALRQAPIEQLTLGQAEASGRLGEWEAYLHTMKYAVK